jgi:hypothetical protein
MLSIAFKRDSRSRLLNMSMKRKLIFDASDSSCQNDEQQTVKHIKSEEYVTRHAAMLNSEGKSNEPIHCLIINNVHV